MLSKIYGEQWWSVSLLTISLFYLRLGAGGVSLRYWLKAEIIQRKSCASKTTTGVRESLTEVGAEMRLLYIVRSPVSVMTKAADCCEFLPTAL